MLSDTKGSGNVSWIGFLMLMAGGAALAANVDLHTGGQREAGGALQAAQAAPVDAQGNAALLGRGMAERSRDRSARARAIMIPAAPATPRVDPPVLEPVQLEEVTLSSPELREPAYELPPIFPADDWNSLLERLIAASALPPAPGPIEVEPADVRQPDFEWIGLRVHEMRRPPRLEPPPVRP